MNALLLITVVTAVVLQSILQKQYNKRNRGQGIYIFNAVSPLCACLIFLLSSLKCFGFTATLIPYILGFSVSFGSAILFTFLAVREGSLSLTSLATSYSLIIPTLYGIFFLGETPDRFIYFGFAFLVLSLFLINSKKDDTKINFKWVVFIVIAFFGNGMCSVIQTAQQLRFNGGYKSEFMILALLTVSVFFFMLSLLKEKTQILTSLKSNAVFMVITGIANGIANLFVMLLISRKIEASIMFPIISGGGIILTCAVSVVFLKEKLTVRQYIGLIFGVASVVLMNI